MILIGQYDSPFVRRVGVALTLYELPFEHRPWSVFSDAEKVRPYNPLLRVPILVLDDGAALIDSHIILDHLDSLVPAERAMFPSAEPARREALRIATLATGAADMAVSLFYEQRMHDEVSEMLSARRRAQVAAALDALDQDRASRPGDYWLGDRIGHVDIAVAATWRFISDAHPDIASPARRPSLAAHGDRLEALPAFKLVSQPFIPPS